MATKDYSTKQEKIVAEYLGWKRVSASGARSFNPGDICSDCWLGECKTHIKSKDTIIFKKRDWDKISSEAHSVFKNPVLFSDNGTQDLRKTFCMFNLDTSGFYPVTKILDADISISCANNIMFSVNEMVCELQQSCLNPVICIKVDGTNIGITNISIFSDLISGR